MQKPTHKGVLIIKIGPLTFDVSLRAAVVSAQPLEERSHHLGAAEALEAGADVLVVPLQSPDLEDPVQGNGGGRRAASDFMHRSVR